LHQLNVTISYITYSPDGSFICACAGNNVFTWPSDVLSTQRRRITESRSLQSVSFSPSNDMIVTCGPGVTSKSLINVWNLSSMHIAKEFVCTEEVSRCLFSPDGKRIVAYNHNQSSPIKFWQLNQEGSAAVDEITTKIPIHSVLFSPDSKQIILFCSSESGGFIIIQSAFPDHDQIVKFDCGPISSVTLSGDGKSIAISDISVINIWGTEGILLQSLQSNQTVQSLSFVPSRNN